MRTGIIRAAAVGLGLFAAQAVAQETLLTDVTVVDVETGDLAPGQSLLIRDGVIAEIGATVEAADATSSTGMAVSSSPVSGTRMSTSSRPRMSPRPPCRSTSSTA